MDDILKQFKFDVLPSPEDSRDFRAEDIMGIVIPLEAEIPIQDFIIPNNIIIQNQLQTSMCTAYTSALIGRIFNWLETKANITLSEGFCYGNRTSEDYQGEGNYIRSVLSHWLKEGICEKKYFPQIGTYPEMKLVFNNLPLEVLENAKKYRLKSYYRVQFNDIEKILYKYQTPLSVGIPIYQNAFTNALNTGIVEKPLADDTNIGGHNLTLIGKRTINNKKYFIAANSWGTEYGDNGYFYLSEDYPLTECWLPLDYKPTEVKLTIGKPEYTINGVKKTMDVAPYIKNSRTYCPISFISLAFGYEVIWHSETKIVEIKEFDHSYYLTIGKAEFEDSVAMRSFPLDTAPEITSNRTCMPIAQFLQYLGFNVYWDAKTQIVTINNL